MSDRPILFSGPMVRALLAGTKTQTRRGIKPQPEPCDHSLWRQPMPDGSRQSNHCDDSFQPLIDDRDLYCRVCSNGMRLANSRKSGVAGIPIRYRVGDRLWVRETTAFLIDQASGKTSKVEGFKADGYQLPQDGWAHARRWLPSIFMPRWASRLTLTVTDVRVERLQDISHDDAVAEGVGIYPKSMSAQKRYREIWETINGPGSWDANPWVVAYTFTVHHGNIDQVLP